MSYPSAILTLYKSNTTITLACRIADLIWCDSTFNRPVAGTYTEVEFLEEIQTEVLRVFLLAIRRHLYLRFVLPSPHLLFFGLEISTSNIWEEGGGRFLG
jgi:hypothetical protein